MQAQITHNSIKSNKRRLAADAAMAFDAVRQVLALAACFAVLAGGTEVLASLAEFEGEYS